MVSTAYPFPDGLLHTLLDVSLTAVNLLRPLYGPDGLKIVDFALDYCNPAAQRMTALPEQPGGTALTRFPDIATNGVFDFYCQVFATNKAGHYEVNYQTDGFNNHFRLAAQRHGELLVVSFTDTADQPHTAVEVALRESEAREKAARAEAEEERAALVRAFAQAPVAIAILRGPNFIVELANQTLGTLWGRPVAPALGRPLFEALPDMAGQGLEQLLETALRTGEPLGFQERPTMLVRNEAGVAELGYYNFTYQPLYDVQGEVTGLLTVGVEVTDQVLARQRTQQLNQELEARVQQRTQALAAAQAEAEQQRQRLDRLVSEAPALIASLTGPHHRVELANDGFRQIFGHRELVGKPYRTAVPEMEGQPFFDLLDEVYRTGETYYGIGEPVDLDRTNSGRLERLYVDYIYQATRDAAGQVDGILIFAHDVTEQVLARQEREMQQQQLQAVFEQVPVAIAVFQGPAHVMEVANPAAAALWGRTSTELVGQPLATALPELRGLGFDALLDGVRATGEPVLVLEQAIPVFRQGRPEILHLNFVYQALRDAQGHIERVAAVGVDVSEQVVARRHVQALNQQLAALNDKLYAANADLADANEGLGDANQQLTRANIDLDAFAYTASHDLRAPITNIESLLTALIEQLPATVLQDEEVRPILRLMQGAVERFQLTLTQLTDVIQTQVAPAQPAEPVDLAALIEGVCLDLAPLLAATNPKLMVDVADCPHLSFAPSNLRSIVYNLLSNALKYRDPARSLVVGVRCHSTERATVLEVSDNGLGLNDGQQDRLFGLFQRLHTHVDGSGVGLYTIKKIVENAGGTITVQSQPGVGSTFTVTLPKPGQALK